MASKRPGPSTPSAFSARKPAHETNRTVAGAPKPSQPLKEDGKKTRKQSENHAPDVVLDFPAVPGLSRAELDALERYLGAEIDRILDLRG